jgi:hypothetical protein
LPPRRAGWFPFRRPVGHLAAEVSGRSVGCLSALTVNRLPAGCTPERCEIRIWPFVHGDSGDTGTTAANPHGCWVSLSPEPEKLSPSGPGDGDNSFHERPLTLRRCRRSDCSHAPSHHSAGSWVHGPAASGHPHCRQLGCAATTGERQPAPPHAVRIGSPSLCGGIEFRFRHFAHGDSGDTGTTAASPHECWVLPSPAVENLSPPGLVNGDNSFRRSSRVNATAAEPRQWSPGIPPTFNALR